MADFALVPGAPQLRSLQVEAVTKIMAAFDAGKSIVVLQAPTGTGKSLIGRTVALNHDRSYLLTPLISLQEQYFNDFESSLKLFKGKAHYSCRFTENPVNEEFCQGSRAPVRYVPDDCYYDDKELEYKNQIPLCREFDACHYYLARRLAAEADCTLMNFMGFTVWMDLRDKMPVAIFDTRDLHVIDEAHKIEDTCRTYLEFKINKRYVVEFALHLLPQFPTDKSLASEVRAFCTKLQDVAYSQVLEKSKGFSIAVPPASNNKKDKSDFVGKIFAEMEESDSLKKRASQHVMIFRKVEKYTNREDYAAGIVDGELVVQPTNVSWFIRDQILGKRTLMMSATIPRDLVLSMGFDSDEVEYIEMDSTFPKENRPIFLTPAGNMNGMHKKSQDEKDTILANACLTTNSILSKIPGDKGIIHVNSYGTVRDIDDYMARYHTFAHGRMIFQEQGGTKEALIEHEESPEPTILVTPSMKEGVDLKDDLSRVQIIWKCPYPSLNTPANKALLKSNPAWYAAQTIANFMQMYGRSIRSEKDWAKTYILDQALIDFLRKHHNKIPRYVTEAIHWR